MQVKLLNYTEDPEYVIGKMAGICYNSDVDNRDVCIRRAAKCADDGHLTTLRFATATFHISDISRACSHQFVRSKHLDFLQRSQRYCKETTASFVTPQEYDHIVLQDFTDAYNKALNTYNELLTKGVKKEDARFVLPEATYTELLVTGNFQAWLDFLKLRADKHAQWEIREVAYSIGKELYSIAPNIFKDYAT